MVFQATTIPAKVLIFGPVYANRSDGTDHFLIAQAYATSMEIPEGEILHSKAVKVKVLARLEPHFKFAGTVLELEVFEE